MVKLLLSAALLVLLAALPPNQALLNARPGTTDIQVPFEGTVFYDLSGADGESITFNGSMHVSSQVTPKGSIRVHANLVGVSGIGEETAIRYNGIGRDGATLESGTSILHDFDFQIIPADGFTLSCILRVTLRLTFSAGGNLTDVDIQQMSVVHFS